MEPIRIAQVSDFHFRRWTSLHDRLQQRLLRLEYDLLAITGDFSQLPWNWRWVAKLVRRFVEPLRCPLGCYGVPGNHDAVELSDSLADGPVRFLRNTSVTMSVNGSAINIAGTDDSWRSFADLPKALAGCRNDYPTILLTHIPSTIHHLPDGLVDLVLSGHTHAGQWRVPWLGGVTVNDRLTRAQTHGLHRIGRRWLHVTAGVGSSGPFPIRVNCPAEIALLRLVADRRAITS
jgi:predicted MPP superfamily phosphohydrolase